MHRPRAAVSRTRGDWERIIVGGLFAGFGGGLTTLAHEVARSWFGGVDPWIGFEMVLDPLVPASMLSPGFDAATVLGLGVHLWLSALFGLTFAVASFELTRSASLPMGAFLGIAFWFLLHEGLLPAQEVLLFAETPQPAIEMLDHLLAGIVVAILYMPFQRDGWAGAHGWASERILVPDGGASQS